MELSHSLDAFLENYEHKGIVSGGGGSSLVLDSERGEIVRAVSSNLNKPVVQKGCLNPEKAMVALRNHSQAERRRRERINGHLATLRNIIPGTAKVSFFFYFFSLVLSLFAAAAIAVKLDLII